MNRKAIEKLLGVKLDDNLSENDDYLLEKLSDALDEIKWAKGELRRIRKREQEGSGTAQSQRET